MTYKAKYIKFVTAFAALSITLIFTQNCAKDIDLDQLNSLNCYNENCSNLGMDRDFNGSIHVLNASVQNLQLGESHIFEAMVKDQNNVPYLNSDFEFTWTHNGVKFFGPSLTITISESKSEYGSYSLKAKHIPTSLEIFYGNVLIINDPLSSEKLHVDSQELTIELVEGTSSRFINASVLDSDDRPLDNHLFDFTWQLMKYNKNNELIGAVVTGPSLELNPKEPQLGGYTYTLCAKNISTQIQSCFGSPIQFNVLQPKDQILTVSDTEIVYEKSIFAASPININTSNIHHAYDPINNFLNAILFIFFSTPDDNMDAISIPENSYKVISNPTSTEGLTELVVCGFVSYEGNYFLKGKNSTQAEKISYLTTDRQACDDLNKNPDYTTVPSLKELRKTKSGKNFSPLISLGYVYKTNNASNTRQPIYTCLDRFSYALKLRAFLNAYTTPRKECKQGYLLVRPDFNTDDNIPPQILGYAPPN